MQNAALFLHPQAIIDPKQGRILGRHAAGESFLRGFFQHAAVDRFCFLDAASLGHVRADALLKPFGALRHPVQYIDPRRNQLAADPRVLHLPDPNMPRESWLRQTFGVSAYAISGITHTTATALTMSIIGDLLLAPLRDHDALICTSSAVHASVEAHLNGVRDYLAREFGPRRHPEPQRVVIPLGVNADDFAASPEARQAWREKLAIPADAIVALYVGRFSVREKMNPALMAMALEKAAQRTGKPLYWINSGWAETAEAGAIYHRETRALCPSVHYIEVDGREPDTRFSIWSAADFFISFSDNIQETFGLTPIEAMAAGLPCVVTDWNGYKDTVRHGEDGFRIPTLAPTPGSGADLAFWFSTGTLNYLDYVGAASQHVVVDIKEAVVAISVLIQSAALRRRMGEQARSRARAVFDWSVIVPQYQALWAEQEARRRAAPAEPMAQENPFRPDPFRLFGNYPTRHQRAEDRLSPAPDITWEQAQARLAAPLASYSRLNRLSADEAAQVFHWLSQRPDSTLTELLAAFPQPRRAYVRRGVLWMARHDVLEIRPAT